MYLPFVCFVALSPKSTAMVMVGRSVHLTTLFPGLAWTSSQPVLRAHTLACNWQQPFLNDTAEGRIMTLEIILWSISTKVWDRAGVELTTCTYHDTSFTKLSFRAMPALASKTLLKVLPMKSEDTTCSSVYSKIPFMGPAQASLMACLISSYLAWKKKHDTYSSR